MPSTSLAATGPTEWVNLGLGFTPVAVTGTFVGSVAFEVRLIPDTGATVFPLARDTSGTALVFTAPSGVVMVDGLEGAPDAQIRGNFTRTSGTAVVQIGR